MTDINLDVKDNDDIRCLYVQGSRKSLLTIQKHIRKSRGGWNNLGYERISSDAPLLPHVKEKYHMKIAYSRTSIKYREVRDLLASVLESPDVWLTGCDCGREK